MQKPGAVATMAAYGPNTVIVEADAEPVTSEGKL
jgi:hypothetical protein